MTTDRDAVERLAPERIWAGILTDEYSGITGTKIRVWGDDPRVGTDDPAIEYVLKSHADAQLQAAVAEMREAAINAQDTREPVKFWRADKAPSKLDRCQHDNAMSEDCADCWEDAILALPAPTDALERAINDAWLAAIAVVADLRDGYHPRPLILNHAVRELDKARRAAQRGE